MASGLRSKLRAIGASAPRSPAPAPGGELLVRVSRRDTQPGIFDLPPAGLRRIGWSGRPFDIRRCLFLDTETTGLSGGAGTVAFLVGAGYQTDDAFVIEQYLMKDYAAEPALIDRLANLMDRFDCVCTFNGRTFDMPLLEARFTMCRMRSRWREMENLDLLAPARRTWKLRLVSCRLSMLEEMVLGIHRDGDLPGSEVPRRYFDYLKCGDVSLLEDIIEHNNQDIATLAGLLVKLCDVWQAPEAALRDKRDLYSVGRGLERQGELGFARRVYRVSAIPSPAGTIEALRGERISGMANWRLYHIARREGDADAMRDTLEAMLRRGQMTPQVLVELSKLYEHRLHRYPAALAYARQALEGCTDEDARLALRKRIDRIERKMGDQGDRNGGV